MIIDEIRSGKKYFKPLPFGDVDGGALISYDAARDVFVEEYMNESIYRIGDGEHFYTERTAEEMLDMLLNGKYTDCKYPLPKFSEIYKIVGPEATIESAAEEPSDGSGVHPADLHMMKCPKCESLRVKLELYDYSINPATGDRYVSMDFKCISCGENTSYRWDD